MTKAGTKTATGASGKEYKFNIYPWGTNFSPVGAVYLILKKIDPGQTSSTILYIGETGDLSTRFDNHHKQDCFDNNGKTHIGIYREDSEKARLAIEKDLLGRYSPPCND